MCVCVGQFLYIYQVKNHMHMLALYNNQKYILMYMHYTCTCLYYMYIHVPVFIQSCIHSVAPNITSLSVVEQQSTNVSVQLSWTLDIPTGISYKVLCH